MSAQGHRQLAAFAACDVLSSQGMLRAAIEEYTACSIRGDLEGAEIVAHRCRKQLDTLLRHIASEQESRRAAILAEAEVCA